MRLVRSHGLGNDYLVLATDQVLTAPVVRALCDRHRGVGGDGVLEHVPSDVADYGLRIWNPDGSQAEKSGNGLRIFARYLVDHCYAPMAFTVEVASGRVRCTIDPGTAMVTVEMGQATFVPDQVPVRESLREAETVVGAQRLRITAVGIGNPHCVCFVGHLIGPSGCIDDLPWRAWGRELEVDARFPNRTNVQFARVLSRRCIELRIWERGAGETQASGSSACAVAAVAVDTHRCDPDEDLELRMPGGSLRVRVAADLELVQTGPVEEIAVVQTTRQWP